MSLSRSELQSFQKMQTIYDIENVYNTKKNDPEDPEVSMVRTVLVPLLENNRYNIILTSVNGFTEYTFSVAPYYLHQIFEIIEKKIGQGHSIESRLSSALYVIDKVLVKFYPGCDIYIRRKLDIDTCVYDVIVTLYWN